MKKRKIVAIFLFMILFLTSCHSSDELDNNQAIGHKYVESMLLEIKNKDKVGLKKEFMKRAVKKDKDFEKGEEYLFDLYKGKLKSWRIDGSTFNSTAESGLKTVEANVLETIQTDKDTYRIYITYYTSNEKNNNDTGVYAFRMIRLEDEDTQFTDDGSLMDIPGIYIPDSGKEDFK